MYSASIIGRDVDDRETGLKLRVTVIWMRSGKADRLAGKVCVMYRFKDYRLRFFCLTHRRDAKMWSERVLMGSDGNEGI